MRLICSLAIAASVLATASPAAAATDVLEPTGENSVAYAPDLSGRQWDMDDIGAPLARQKVTGAGVTVAVIDTGIDIQHPEFTGRIVQPTSWICPAGVTVPCQGLQYVDDGHGHGTHVAGTVAAADDGQGITGVAPAAKIMPLRVGDANGSIKGDLTGAVRYAVAHGADVITMSIGYIAGLGPLVLNPVVPLAEFSEAVSEAQAAGILVTLAAGNDAAPYCGQGETWQDAALCVGAYGPAGDPAVYSDWGYEIDINAPGGGLLSCQGSILSTVPLEQSRTCPGTPGYRTMSGTSMATPHVAGVGALLAQQGITGAAAASLIVQTARNRSSFTLAGGLTGPRLDAAAAVGAR